METIPAVALGVIIGVVGAVYALVRRMNAGMALVFISLVLVSIWHNNLSWVEWVIFIVAFAVTLWMTSRPKVSAITDDNVRVIKVKRSHLGIGLLQLLLAFLLATTWDLADNPFTGWTGWLMLALVLFVIGVVLWLLFKTIAAFVVLAVLAAMTLVLGLGVNGLIGDGGGKSASPGTTTTTTSATSTGTSTTSSASPSTAQPPSDGEAGVEDSDGTKRSLPLVDQKGDEVTPVDTTGDQRSPSSYADALKGGPVENWTQLEARMRSMQWYVDGVNARKGKTGFDWSDVQKWAKDGADIDTRVIQVYNYSSSELSDTAVRDRARVLIGDAADDLPIKRHNCAVNTRGLSDGKLQDFVDCRKMVRVTLAPLVYEDGIPVALEGDSGIFVDCFNVWWLPRQVVKHGPPPTKTATPTHKATTPSPKPSTTTLSPKRLSQHPAEQGNGPAVQADPAPAPTARASAPGGLSTPKSTSTTSSSPSPTSTSTPVVVDTGTSITSTSPPTW